MFKWLLDNSLTNRLLVIIASVVLMAYGAFTLSRTPVDVFPDLNKPTVTIMTEAGGMAAEEVEQLITFPLETTMNGLPGVESVRSTSSAGLSFVYVTFDWSTEIFRARQLVSERLSSMEEGLAGGVVTIAGGKEAAPVSSLHKCMACGSGLSRRPSKKKGQFWWGCSNFPTCKQTYPDLKGRPDYSKGRNGPASE